MKILFIGAVEFSKHCLEEVLMAGGEVIAILTLPKEKAGFYSDYTDLTDVAIQYSIPIYKLGKKISHPGNVELIRSLAPDVIFVFGWSQLITKDILDIPRYGVIGTHPALLPKNRGRHPLIWALIEGLEESGLTFFYIDEGIDSGDIIWQRPFPITPEDTARTLYDKMKDLASIAIPNILSWLCQGSVPRLPQDHSKATYWRKRGDEDGEIDWSKAPEEVRNLIRALTKPYVGAHTYIGGKKCIIWKINIEEDE